MSGRAFEGIGGRAGSPKSRLRVVLISICSFLGIVALGYVLAGYLFAPHSDLFRGFQLATGDQAVISSTSPATGGASSSLSSVGDEVPAAAGGVATRALAKGSTPVHALARTGVSPASGGSALAAKESGHRRGQAVAATARDERVGGADADASEENEGRDEAGEAPELLSIAGQVLNEAGEPVGGVTVTAASRHLFRSPADTVAGDSMGYESWTDESWTDWRGLFRFDGLHDGEYELRTDALEPYLTARAVVRAGVDAVTLVLREAREEAAVSIYGMVVDTEQQPLTGVRVLPVGQHGRAVLSDANGTYQLSLTMADYASLRFSRNGYREERISLHSSHFEGLEKLRVDAQLEAVETLTTVTGVVRDVVGNAVPGERVQLTSSTPLKFYRAGTDRAGEFAFVGVEVGENYFLSVRPSGPYQDYKQGNIAVSANGLDMEIVLEPLRSGVVTGRMVDVNFAPIPLFTLWVRSTNANMQPPVRVTGDSSGSFVVEDALEGGMVFETRSIPHLSVSYTPLSPAAPEDVEVILDWGTYDLQGRVVDGGGEPVPAPELTLSWSHHKNGTQSRSLRRAVGDHAGYFVFTQLGPGRHTLDVTAEGFRLARLTHEVGSSDGEILVRMEERGR